MASGPIITIETAVIPELQTIELYESTTDHIRERHPELSYPTMEAAVIAAVSTTTTSVHASRTSKSSVIFVDSQTTNTSGDSLRVPVKIMGDGVGIIRTAYFSSVQSPGEVIWRRA
jgi:hypothetical protein